MATKPAESEETASSEEAKEPKGHQNPEKSLDKALELLQARNDTSRFVGLALMKSMLDNHSELRENTETVSRCWRAIPVKFLDRLLNARATEKRSSEEAQSMIALAVAVVHVFVTLLPAEELKGAAFTERADGLVAAVPLR